ncbi:MAG: hypothetical protein ACPLW7_00955 [Minisyncoccia bacterium]
MSESRIKSGKEIVDEFFEMIEKIPEVDQSLAKEIKELYKSGKLTDTNLKNLLDALLEQKMEA